MCPDFHRGTGYPSMLATNPAERLKTVSAASVRGHIWAPSDSVNAFLQFYFKDVRKSQKFNVLEHCEYGKSGYEPVKFKSALIIFCQGSR